MLARALAVVIALSAVSVSLADEAEERFVASVRAAIQEREAKRAELEDHLRDLKAGRINRAMKQRELVTEARGRKRYVWNNPEAKEKAVAEVAQKIRNLGSDDDDTPSLPYGDEMTIGLIGKLPTSESEPATVISGQQAFTGTQSRFHQYSIRQVIDDRNALVEWKRSTTFFADRAPTSSTRLFWLVGSTDGLIDGSQLNIGGNVFRVTDTRKYDTAVGSTKTVYVLEPFDASQLIQKAKQAAPQSR